MQPALCCYIINIFLCLSSFRRVVSVGASSLVRARVAQPPTVQHRVDTALSPLGIFTRGRATLTPKQVKNIRRHKGQGTPPHPHRWLDKMHSSRLWRLGNTHQGNGARLSRKQLTAAQDVIMQTLRQLKDTKVYLRVFPDIPVCINVRELAAIL